MEDVLAAAKFSILGKYHTMAYGKRPMADLGKIGYRYL